MSFSDNLIPISIARYGKAIKKYAIAHILMIIMGIIITLALLPIIEQMGNLDPTNEQALFDALEPIMDQFATYGFLLLVVALIALVFLIQYMSKLNHLSKITNDINLRNVFRIEIANILFPLIVALFVSDLVIISILSMIPTILSIVAIFLLEKWIQGLPAQMEKPPIGEQSKTIFLLMKVGLGFSFILEILGFFLPFPGIFGLVLLYLGDVLYAVMFWKLGHLIYTSFPIQNVFSQSPISYNQQQYPAFNTTNTPSTREYGQERPNVNEPRLNPQITLPAKHGVGVSKNHCPFCGAPKIDPESTFCSTCGQKFK